MKYLAILRDSFREAIDSKVIYALVALSLLVTLFMLSMSFTPHPADEAFHDLFNMGRLPGPDGRGRRARPAQVDVNGVPAEKDKEGDHPQQRRQVLHPEPRYRGVDLLQGAPDSPDSDYRLTFYMDLGDKLTADLARKELDKRLDEMQRDLNKAEEFGMFKVTKVRLADPNNRHARDAAQRDRDEGVFLEFDTSPTAATRRLWPFQVSLFFGSVPVQLAPPQMPLGRSLGMQLYFMASLVLWMGSLVALLISVIITAFFIPNMLRKGTVDLLVVKPIHRWVLLVYKYIGGLTFVFLNTAVALLGIWVALGLRSGVWANSFLLMIFTLTFFFAILYAVSTLAGVLTRSAIVAILVTCAAWFAFFIVGTIHGVFDNQRQMEARLNTPEGSRWGENTFGQVIRAIHFVTPRTSELDALGSKLLMADFLTDKLAEFMAMREIHWWETISVSLAYIALFVGASCWWFSTKDY